jgi:hypothetical protein
VYISRDRGETWTKSNIDIGIPHQIRDVEFDIHDASTLWLASEGCGFYKGLMENGESVQVVKVTPGSLDFEKGVNSQLTAEIINPAFAGERVVWKSDNPAIATVDENGKFTPHSRGKVTIWASTENGRYSDNCMLVVKEINTSSEMLRFENEIRFYPNPANRSITILNIDEKAQVEILNLSGQKIKSFIGQKVIDVSELTNGIYLLKIRSGSKESSAKFVKNDVF